MRTGCYDAHSLERRQLFQTIACGDVPRLVGLLGGAPGGDILDVLADRYTDERSYDFERLLRESGIPVGLFVYGG